jgi:hypothetical protein
MAPDSLDFTRRMRVAGIGAPDVFEFALVGRRLLA